MNDTPNMDKETLNSKACFPIDDAIKSLAITEEQRLLQQASAAIRSLRTENQLLRSRLDVFDSMMSLFKTRRDDGCCAMGPDITWEIDRLLTKKLAGTEKY